MPLVQRWMSVCCIHVAEIVEPVFVRGVLLLGGEKQGLQRFLFRFMMRVFVVLRLMNTDGL